MTTSWVVVAHRSGARFFEHRGIDLVVQPGTIHCVVGENGAGKSTLMKIISGAQSRDAGEISIDGAPVEITGPRHAQALGKALWKIYGPRVSPDVVVDRMDQSTLHFSTFVARDFDERDVLPCGTVLVRGKGDLTIRGSHMYCAAQGAEVVRLLAGGRIVMDQEDLEVTDLPGLPGLQQQMLDGTMRKPKGVSLVQADRAGRRGRRRRSGLRVCFFKGRHRLGLGFQGQFQVIPLVEHIFAQEI